MSLQDRVSIILPIFILLFLVGINILYGFVTVYSNDTNIQYVLTLMANLIMDTVFTLIGFGLLLSPYKNQKWTGMSIALLVVSFNIILGLLMQDMWFEIFFGFRKDIPAGIVGGFPNAKQFWTRHSFVGKSTSSFYSFRLSNLCSVSYLVGMTAFNGRVTLSNIFFSLPVFCFLFYLNFYLNALLCYSTTYKVSSFDFFDSYGTILIYLFGGVYGIITGFFTKSEKTQQLIEKSEKHHMSLQMSILGSFFIFATFCLSYTDIIYGATNTLNYISNSGFLLTTLGLSAGVLGHYAISILTGSGRPHIEGIIIGTISGGIMVGAIPQVISNLGAILFLGFMAGVVSGLSSNFITPKINSTHIIDSQGILGPIVIVSILACFVVHPSVISALYDRNQSLPALDRTVRDYRDARYYLAYFAVTLGIAIVTGVVMGVISKIKKSWHHDFLDTKFFVDDYGLYQYEEKEKAAMPIQTGSAAHINDEKPI